MLLIALELGLVIAVMIFLVYATCKMKDRDDFAAGLTQAPESVEYFACGFGDADSGG